MRTRVALVAATLCGLAGCTIAGSSDTVIQLTPLREDSEIHLTTDTEPPLTLYVSNQSFEDDPVLLTVSIDGVPLVDGRFYVEGQHNWVAVPIELPPGEHTMIATSETGPTLTETFETEPQKRLWAILDYWYYPDEDGRYLAWSTHLEQPGFS